MADLDDAEFPPGSQKRQEKERELEHAKAASSELTKIDGEPEKVPEEVWRGSGG